MIRRPLIWFTICWIGGSAAAASLDSRAVVLAGAGLFIAALALGLLRLASWPLAAACIMAYGLAAGQRGWADARNITAHPELQAAAEAAFPSSAYAVQVTGTIISAVTVDGDRAQLRVTADTVRVQGEEAPRKLSERLMVQVRLALQPDQAVAAGWKRGDRISAAGELTLPASATNFGGFDYRRYLHSQRIHWLFKVDGAAALATEPGPRWTAAALLGRVDAIRLTLGARMDALYPEQHAGFMKGLVLGILEDIDPVQYRQFSGLGLTHILAISGLHVAVFLYCLHSILRLTRMSRESIMNVLIFAVPFYILLFGAAPSVIRAGIMAMIGLFAAKHRQLKDGLHLLAAAALMMLIAEPYMLENVSFQLSCLVTAGLIVGVTPIRKILPSWRRGKIAMDILAVSFVAQVVSFPLTIYYFNQFNLLSLPANMLIVPILSSVVLPLGTASLVLSTIWMPLAQWLSYVVKLLNELTFSIIETMNMYDQLRMIWPSPPIWWIVSWYAVLLAGFRAINIYAQRNKMKESSHSPEHDATVPLYGQEEAQTKPLSTGSALPWPSDRAGKLRQKTAIPLLLSVLCAGLLIYGYRPDRFDSSIRVHMLDVGQGDAFHVRTAAGRHILIDGGGTLQFRKPGEEWKSRKDPFEIGRKVVVPLLMKRGVQQIDLLVFSHLDTDHVGGLTAVLQSIPVKRILWNGTMKPSDEVKELFQTAIRLQIPVYTACAQQLWELELHVEMAVMWPQRQPAEGECGAANGAVPITMQNNQNDYSLVLLLKLYGHSLLMTGDIRSSAEQWVLRSLRENQSSAAIPPIDILKIAHHGSRSSTTEEWLRYWSPQTALISVGRHNFYGHPHPAVLTRLEENDARILRTDRDGEVQFRFTNAGIEMRKKIEAGALK
ncbi:ComEC/Rec2 family competence protein [Paenibacillus abyssi]|uniref:DNA internalization-related competence protein ComEC/Rec2 n=1 Tax=Paenibacillus abyssi TaxID=1340531 RepID=A0A917D702_9BACL|nr:ComEC/Rec2 family competence protein [Paenibacillus abyssi]GGG10988.1 DNA internalization-related competence protein ComEC/Rec2 [Paenibacillus abyssi]